MKRSGVAALSLVATCLFFIEYLPPFKRVHLPYDLQGFHYPLLNYAFKSLRDGRFPEWDPTIYCGLSFVGNVQAALFYPPNWLLFLAHLGRRDLAFKAVEALVIVHVWLAFLLCYVWLRERRTGALASAMGAGVFAYSGYMVSQIQHMGVVTGYAWWPLGLWGIDQAVRQRRWQPLWKLAVASALCFLAGYPPTWFVFCVCAMIYALTLGGPRWVAPAAAAALASSVLLVMVQLLPALEAASLKTPEKKYGGGIRGAEFYLSYVLPSYFHQGRESTDSSEPTGEYFYFGAPVFFGLAWMVRRRGWRDFMPALAMASVSLVMMTNPFNLVEPLVDRVPFLTEVCRDWNFLAGMTLAAALLASVALDGFLKGASGRVPGWLSLAAIGLLAGWSVRQVLVWLPGPPDFAFGWRAVLEPSVMLAAFSLGVYALRAEPDPRRRVWLMTAVVVAVWVDYKVFGTDKRFNAAEGDADGFFNDARTSGPHFTGMDDAVYRQLLSDPAFRVAVDATGPHATDLRHYGLATPQGFDPLLPRQYKEAIEAFTAFRTDRLFDIDPANQEMLQRLSVRYFLTIPAASTYQTLSASSNFRLLEPSGSYFHVFEYLRARPAFRWEADGNPSDAFAERTSWSPERREFFVRSPSGGRFVLVEQFFPGWRATVDGRPATIERWGGAFQAIRLGPGEHRLQFEFRSRGLRIGALITIASLGCLWGIARRQ